MKGAQRGRRRFSLAVEAGSLLEEVLSEADEPSRRGQSPQEESGKQMWLCPYCMQALFRLRIQVMCPGADRLEGVNSLCVGVGEGRTEKYRQISEIRVNAEEVL